MSRRWPLPLHLLLFAFLLCGITPRALATSIERFTLTNALVDPECVPPAATSDFLTSDARASLWVQLHDVRVGDTYIYSWFDPTGRLFHRHSLTRGEEAENPCSWSSITVRGGLASTRPGRWRVQLSYNGVVQIDESFLLVESGRVEAAGLATGLPPLAEMPVNPLPLVSSAEPRLWLAARLSELRPGDSYGVRWISPGGAVVSQYSSQVEGDAQPLIVWNMLPLAEGAVKPAPGRWRAEVSINGLIRRTVPFTVRLEGPHEIPTELRALYGDGPSAPCASRSNPIEQRLLPRGARTFRNPNPADVARMEAVIEALTAGRYGEAETLARSLQHVLGRHIDAQTGRVTWVIEPAVPGEGPGFAVMLFHRPDGDPALIAEIPSPGYDDRTVDFGLALLEHGAGWLLVSGAHTTTNYRPADRLEAPLCAMKQAEAELVPGLDDSDVTRNEESMFHRVHSFLVERAASRQTPPMVVQLRGFGDEVREGKMPESRGCDHHLVLSNGEVNQADEPALLVELASQLSRYSLQGHRSSSRYDSDIYIRSGADCTALSAGEVVQGRQVRQAGGVFVSIALDEAIRTFPAEADAVQVADAIWETFSGQWREVSIEPPRTTPAPTPAPSPGPVAAPKP